MAMTPTTPFSVFGVPPPSEPDALCVFCLYPLDADGRCPAAQAGTEQVITSDAQTDAE